jgi:basic membrane protein A and related proteins
VTAVKACFVTDLAGVDDRSFNAEGWRGVGDAEAAGFVEADPILLESDVAEDYQPNIDQCLSQGAQHIVTNGFALGDATKLNAEANPDVKFTIIDFGYDPDIPNVRELVYQTDEAAFAAGYLAAGVSQSGIIGTYGGVNIPTVSIFLDGLTRGVAHYNELKGTDVRVIGWDVDARTAASQVRSTRPTRPCALCVRAFSTRAPTSSCPLVGRSTSPAEPPSSIVGSKQP